MTPRNKYTTASLITTDVDIKTTLLFETFPYPVVYQIIPSRAINAVIVISGGLENQIKGEFELSMNFD